MKAAWPLGARSSLAQLRVSEQSTLAPSLHPWSNSGPTWQVLRSFARPNLSRLCSQGSTFEACFFEDARPSRFSLIRGTSNSWSMLTSQEFHLAGEADHSIMWIERVASESNIADLPSRGAGLEAAALIGGRFEGDLEMPIEAME